MRDLLFTAFTSNSVPALLVVGGVLLVVLSVATVSKKYVRIQKGEDKNKAFIGGMLLILVGIGLFIWGSEEQEMSKRPIYSSVVPTYTFYPTYTPCPTHTPYPTYTPCPTVMPSLVCATTIPNGGGQEGKVSSTLDCLSSQQWVLYKGNPTEENGCLNLERWGFVSEKNALEITATQTSPNRAQAIGLKVSTGTKISFQVAVKKIETTQGKDIELAIGVVGLCNGSNGDFVFSSPDCSHYIMIRTSGPGEPIQICENAALSGRCHFIQWYRLGDYVKISVSVGTHQFSMAVEDYAVGPIVNGKDYWLWIGYYREAPADSSMLAELRNFYWDEEP